MYLQPLICCSQVYSQSTVSTMDTFGTGPKSLSTSERGKSYIESKKGEKKGRD